MVIRTQICVNGRVMQYDHRSNVTTTADLEKFVDHIARDLKVQGRSLMNAKKLLGDEAIEKDQN